MKTPEEYFNDKYGAPHMRMVVAMDDLDSIYSLMEEYANQPPVTEGEMCDAFYEWEGHQEYTTSQKPAALQGWRACFEWLLSK